VAHEQHVLTSPPRAPSARLLVAALVLTGLAMRTAVTSVGAVLDDVERGLHAGGGGAGLITTLPVISFAVLGSWTPRLAHRIGPQRLLVLALGLSTLGLLSRAVTGSIWLFVPLSLVALSGGAVSNVLLPSLVKRHFPHRIGRMTAVYTTALAVGTTLAAGLTVPVGNLGDGWRLGLGSWALLPALAVLPWLPTLRADRPDRTIARGIAATALLGSRTAWALMLFFAFQSFQAYIAFGWFEKFLHAHAISSGTAGWMVALFSAVSIPVSMIGPTVAPARLRWVVGGLSACSLLAYLGLAAAPTGGAWLWMVLAGVGSGTFPIALTLIGLRSNTAETTAALSAFVQAAGYLIAGTGPLLFGVLYGATGHWGWPLALLFIALAVSVTTGWRACRPVPVDDELAASAP
jgi:CP family cyanate transporter-like MFS transporter